MNAGIGWMVQQLLGSKAVKETISVAQAKKDVLAYLEANGPTRLPILQRIMKRNEGSTYQNLRLMVLAKEIESVKLNQYLTYYRIPGDKRAFKD